MLFLFFAREIFTKIRTKNRQKKIPRANDGIINATMLDNVSAIIIYVKRFLSKLDETKE